jgi:hypothetical protein
MGNKFIKQVNREDKLKGEQTFPMGENILNLYPNRKITLKQADIPHPDISGYS